MGRRKKTNEQFTKEVYELVGDEYIFLGTYKYSFKHLPVVHNKCGHRYETTPVSFLTGSRCPKCKKGITKWTDEMFVERVKEEVGDEYTFLETYVTMNTKLPVVHNHCGHRYEVKPTEFIHQGSRCPSCNIRRKWTNEMFLSKVKEEVGDEYTFLKPYVNTRTKLEVVHNKCGHRYKVTPNSFLTGRRCQHCYTPSNKWTNEMFVERVKEEVGDEYTFLESYVHSQTNLAVVHNTCGHRYEVTPATFIHQGSRCPSCGVRKGERKIADYLDKQGILYEMEKTFSDLKVERSLRYDFAIYHKGELLTLIEYDGKQHFVAVDYFGGVEQLLKTQEYDRIKNEYARQNNIPLLRIPYNKYDSIEEIIDRYLSDHF